VLHVMKYLSHKRATSLRGVENELESFLGRLQPQWRGTVRQQRYLPSMIVAHHLPTATQGGIAGRPGAAVENRPNVYLAGDWVGPQGQLADAAAASGASAAHLALASLHKTERSVVHAAT